MSGKNHLHQYKKVRLKATEKLFVLSCQLSNCSHYIHYEARKLLIGKKSICNRCHNEFIINEKHVNQAKPHCDNCIKVDGRNRFQTKTVKAREFSDTLSDLLSRAIQGNDNDKL